MKFFTAVILTGLLAFVAGLYLPWWSVAVAAFIVAALGHQKAGKAFLGGFFGIFLFWGLLSYIIDSSNSSLLSEKVATLLKLGGNSLLLVLVTAVIGGLAGGFGAMTGSFLRSSGK